ncbi:MAG TPA: hypothetical protein VHI71_11945 [Actinomycetota bacterium]|nr:hypothetical protein [Actinomycetota bacterium]
MRRLSTRTLAVLSLAGLVAAASAPAFARSSRPKQHRGKKAIGEIVSFDEATMTLTVDLPGEEDFTGAVDPDVQVKLDHRGWAKRGGGHGNPTEGSIDDLLPGTPVLRMKTEDDVVTKIRIRPLPDDAPLPPAEGDDSQGGDSTDDSDSNPDDESDGDTEDALPPLPVPQP